jgi:hypothetical protein
MAPHLTQDSVSNMSGLQRPAGVFHYEVYSHASTLKRALTLGPRSAHHHTGPWRVTAARQGRTHDCAGSSSTAVSKNDLHPWGIHARGFWHSPTRSAFRAGAALATLHPVAAGLRPEAPGALLRKGPALQAAEACPRAHSAKSIRKALQHT